MNPKNQTKAQVNIVALDGKRIQTPPVGHIPNSNEVAGVIDIFEKLHDVFLSLLKGLVLLEIHLYWLLPSVRRLLLPLLPVRREVPFSSLPRRGIVLSTSARENGHLAIITIHFLTVKWDSAIDRGGESFSFTRETTGV